MAIIHSQYRESGYVTINPETCISCGACAKICPAEVIKQENNKLKVDTDTLIGCIACGHCMMVCPTNAVKVTGRGMQDNDIQPMPAKEEMASDDQLYALMKSRRSIRKFTEEPVSQEMIKKIIDMASTAPMGIPPWDIGIVTVSGKENVRNLVEEISKGYESALKIFKPWVLKLMSPLLGKAKYEMFSNFIVPLAQSYVDYYKQGHDMLFYEAPTVFIFHHSPYTESTDATIACTYAMLAAESLGLGSTIIGGAAPIIQRDKKLSASLGIPKTNKAALALVIGHPAVSFRKTIKRRFI